MDGRTHPTSTFSNSSQHNCPITVLQWSPSGKRVITGDKKGVVCAWTVDARGALTPTRQYRKKGEITSAVFCSVPSSASGTGGAGRKSEANKSSTTAFFFGTDRGAVVYADDMGICTDVQQLSSSIDTMLFYEERSRLIIITRSLLLTQYQVAEDGKVTRVMQVKLSVAGDVAEKGLKSVIWASPGLLAIATQEKMVRLLDLAADESYNLSLSALGNMVERTDKVITVAFGPLDRYLAVGTQGGIIGMWRYTGPSRDVSGSRSVTIATTSADWELLYKTKLQSPIHMLTWHSGQGTAAAITDDGAVVFTETKLSAGTCGELHVVQTSSHEVAIHIRGSSESWVQNTGIPVRGLAVGKSCFVVWSGKTARVYRVDPQLLRCEAQEPFSCSGRALAIADASVIVDDAVFIAEQSCVKVANFAGTQKGSISFTEAEGSPEHLDLNGQFLGVVTNKGIIKVFDVHAPTKPKPLGSSGRFLSPAPAAAAAAPSKATSSAAAAARTSASRTAGSSSSSSSSSTATAAAAAAAAAASLSVRKIKINSNGTRIGILADRLEGALQVRHPDTQLHVYDRNKGAVNVFDFSPHRRCPTSIFWDDADDRLVVCEATRNRAVMTSLTSQVDAPDRGSSIAPPPAEVETDNIPEVEVFMFFATTENGILMQDSFARKQPFGSMIGIVVPKLFFRDAANLKTEDEENEGKTSDSKPSKVYSKIMRDFVGLDEVDAETRVALLDFSYHLTLGKLDEAYRAVKAIDSPAIWENMAQMCVKTKRLDVAEVCLGNMGHARGAAAVRQSKKDPHGSLEASVGCLAIQLGLLDDASRLFREANRFDLLNRLYQSAGVWDKAINVATTHDRIHLKNTHYRYAQHMESVGETQAATEHYELSETGRQEVPRMLYQLNKVDELEDYVHRSEDAALLKWWGAYLESNERFDKARKYYNKAGDHLSLVRICCFKVGSFFFRPYSFSPLFPLTHSLSLSLFFPRTRSRPQGDFNKAAEIVASTGDSAAAYHFARQLENQGEHVEAINFYAESGCYNHSIRLARAHGLDAELMRFALKSTKSLMLECASHFESRGELDKAIQLYHRGGDLVHAMDLCFKAGEGVPTGPGSRSAQSQGALNSVIFDMLNTIAHDLGADTNPQTLAKCAEFLVQHKQFDRAVELYVMAKRYLQAVEMCLQHRVNISEDMVERMTPPEVDGDNSRREILMGIAKALKLQGSYTLASKKYTQAGDRVRAIKCLVRGGDTKAVIQFASISRNAEIYKLAANYLQQMNWRESVEIMKAIITFYTKAKAFEQLAGFYDSCAQVEIDDYRDYEKAIGALRESLKHLAKAGTRQAEDMASHTERRIAMIEKFVQARKLAAKDPDTMVAICEALLQEPNLEDAVRSGDCLAMLVEHFFSRGKLREAYGFIQEMERRKVPPQPYVDAEILEQVYRASGVDKASRGGASAAAGAAGGGGQASSAQRSPDRKGAGMALEERAIEGEEIDEEIGEELEEEAPVKPQGRGYGRGGGGSRK